MDAGIAIVEIRSETFLKRIELSKSNPSVLYFRIDNFLKILFCSGQNQECLNILVQD
jgi:hypothetical protein